MSKVAVLRRGRVRIGYPLSFEGTLIELIQLLPDLGVKLRDRKELLIAQGRDNPRGYVAHAALGIRFVFRFSYASRDCGGSIVFRKLVIDGVDALILPALIVDDCRLAVVRNEDLCNATEVFVHMDMGIDPRLLFFISECLDISILAVCHDSDEDIHLCNLAGIRINKFGGIASPVHFHLLPGFPVDVHGCAAFVFVLLDVIAELGIHQRFFAGLAAVLHVFCPQELL